MRMAEAGGRYGLKTNTIEVHNGEAISHGVGSGFKLRLKSLFSPNFIHFNEILTYLI